MDWFCRSDFSGNLEENTSTLSDMVVANKHHSLFVEFPHKKYDDFVYYQHIYEFQNVFYQKLFIYKLYISMR